MDIWSLHFSATFALAVAATIGYLMGRKSRTTSAQAARISQRELRKAHTVVQELEEIAVVVRKHLTKHHASLNRFKQRVDHLGTIEREVTWRQLCQEAEEMLKPTLNLAAQIANACDQIRQQSHNLMAFTEVRTDPLTDVSNRRALDETIAQQFALMSRYGSTFSVVMLDIDHFKRVNDERGHLEGDRILQDVARILSDSVRETDLVARYGGEEFLVVMPQTDLESASRFSERMRLIVARESPVTVSGGVTMAMDGDSPESLLLRADASLYSAKTTGRNCIFRHNGEEIELAREDVDVASV